MAPPFPKNFHFISHHLSIIPGEASATPPTYTGDRDADFQAVYDYMSGGNWMANFMGSAKEIHHILEQ